MTFDPRYTEETQRLQRLYRLTPRQATLATRLLEDGSRDVNDVVAHVRRAYPESKAEGVRS